MLCVLRKICLRASKMPKNAKNWGFVPYSDLKNMKKWRISAGLRAKNAGGVTIFCGFWLGGSVLSKKLIFL